jgi:hypothetical protein
MAKRLEMLLCCFHISEYIFVVYVQLYVHVYLCDP